MSKIKYARVRLRLFIIYRLRNKTLRLSLEEIDPVFLKIRIS